MGATLTNILAQTNELLKFNQTGQITILSTADRQDMIIKAVREYSVRRPYFGLYAQTAGASNWYSLPTDFEEGFSSLLEIEYPIEYTPINVIDEADYSISIMSGGKKLRFKQNAPTSGDVFWIKYTKRHTFDSSNSSTVPLSDELGICYLACSLMCYALADHYAGRADPNLSNIEMPEGTSRQSEYQTMAEAWYKKYDKEITEENTGFVGNYKFVQDLYFERGDE